MARIDNDNMDLEEEEIDMDADDDNDADFAVNVIMPPPNPSIFPVPKSKPRVVNHWTNLSEDWNAEETGRARPLDTLYGSGVHEVSGKKDRAFSAYAEEFEENTRNVAARLDFHNRKAPWELKKIQPAVVHDEEEDEGEIHSDEGEDNAQPEPEDDDSEWTKRLKGPRMRMYADEEEANRKRNLKIKALHSQHETDILPAKLQVKVDFGDPDDFDEDRPPRITHRRRLSRDETVTGLGSRLLGRVGDVTEIYDRPGASRRPKYDDESDFRQRNLYTRDMDRVIHRTIDGHRQKPSIKDRLGLRTSTSSKPRGERDRGDNKLSIKDRLGSRRFLDRD